MSYWYSDYDGHGLGYGYTVDPDVIDRAVALDAAVAVVQELGEPSVTLEQLKAHLQYDEPCEGGQAFIDQANLRLQQSLDAAIDQAEQYTARSLRRRQLERVLDRFPAHYRDRIELPRPPVLCVHEIRYRDCGVDRLMSSNEWRFMAQTGAVCPQWNCHWPCTMSDHGAVRIRYDAGYTAETIPAGLKSAVLVMAATFFENVEDAAPVQLYQIPRSAEMMLVPYKCQEIF